MPRPYSASMPQSVTVRPVTTKADIDMFLRVPFALYRDDPNWVAPLWLERREHLDPNKNPYFRHADVQLFLAERDGSPVGRVSAQIDRLRLEHHPDATGQFGFLEAPDDAAVFSELFAAAENWLRQRGIVRVQGPFSFSINDETGLLVDGFDTPPSMMMGHAPRYYGPRVEQAGFAKAKDVFAYHYDTSIGVPPHLRAAFDRALRSPDLSIRTLDKRHLARDLDIIIGIFNDAWSDNWGFVPFTKEEITALGKNLKLLVREGYVAIASWRGEPAAMVVTLPNINEWIRGLDGRLLPFGWARLAWSLLAKPPASIRVPLMGVRRKFHGTLTGSLLALAVIDSVRRYHMGRGTTRGEFSWVLEDNWPMRKIIETVVAKPYKTYRIYEKAL